LGVGLALAAPALAVGAVDFDDADPLGLEVPSEPGSIGARPFDADQLDRAEIAQPPQQQLVAALGGCEALDAEEGPSVVQSRSYVHVEVCIDPADDAPCQIGHCHPFVGLGWGDTAPSGTTDKTARGLYRQAPMRSLRPTGRCRVGDRARPTDRTKDSPKGRQPDSWSQTWPGHPPTR